MDARAEAALRDIITQVVAPTLDELECRVAAIELQAPRDLASELNELRLRLNIAEERLGLAGGRLPRGSRLREREVVRLRGQGLSVRRIAVTLGISYGTVQADLVRAAATLAAGMEGRGVDGKKVGERRMNGANRRRSKVA